MAHTPPVPADRNGCVPASPVLLNLKGVNVGIIRLMPINSAPEHHPYWPKNDAVPVNGRLFIKTVFDLQGNGVTFFPAKNGPGLHHLFWLMLDCP